jgi:hypothetical protein
MKNIPTKIYLQVDADGETPEDFKELEVTWATDRIFNTDIEYVIADIDSKEKLLKETAILGTLVLTIEKYNQLLSDELTELVGMALVHGWKSKRFEEGVAFREKIAELKSFLQ